MVSTGNEVSVEVGGDAIGSGTTDGHNNYLNSWTSKKGLLGDGSARGHLMSPQGRGRAKFLKVSSSLSLASPSGNIRRILEERDEISRSVPSSASSGIRGRFSGVLSRKIHWPYLRKLGKEWIKNPYNMALLLWMVVVIISGAILFLVMTGMLNKVLPKKSERDIWFEVNNQILNALFTLMCLYQHPQRFYHLVLLCRWRAEDISTLRKIYCKNGTYKPNEWTHMMVVVILLHINCFATYALCGLNLGYKRSKRPAIGVGVCISFAIGAAAMAGVYIIVSPLGREYNPEMDEEAQDQNQILAGNTTRARAKSLEKILSFASRNEQKIVENNPIWSGGLFDIWDDISIAYLSLFCSFCVFGWNMDRLGFGNMYVHIATFLLFCMAPYWIFNLAAGNINDETIREALGLAGVVLCIFGLLYGGFWRIQMRKRFNLPESNACCGQPEVTDCAQWLLCCWCSLAQEVRTADYYDIVENRFCSKEMYENGQSLLSTLPREGGTVPCRSGPSSPLGSSLLQLQLGPETSPSPTRLSTDRYSPQSRYFPRAGEESSAEPTDNNIMKPPNIPSAFRRESDTDSNQLT